MLHIIDTTKDFQGAEFGYYYEDKGKPTERVVVDTNDENEQVILYASGVCEAQAYLERHNGTLIDLE